MVSCDVGTSGNRIGPGSGLLLLGGTRLPYPPCLARLTIYPHTPVQAGAVPSVSSQQGVGEGLVSQVTLSTTCLC